MSDLENMTLLELRNFAKEHNIKNISKLKKEELIVLLKLINRNMDWRRLIKTKSRRK